MKLRLKDNHVECFSNRFNIQSIGEIVVCFDDGMDSDYIKNYEAWLEKSNQWKCLSQAFKDRDVIIDNYNTYFFEPDNEEEKQRGYRL